MNVAGIVTRSPLHQVLKGFSQRSSGLLQPHEGLTGKRLGRDLTAGHSQQQGGGQNIAGRIGQTVPRPQNATFQFIGLVAASMLSQRKYGYRSEERRVGKECGSKWKHRWSATK